MTESTLDNALRALGFTDGWAISGETLVLWEHDQDPPAPLVRPDASTPNTASDPA